MITAAENELLTRIENDAPMGRLLRENYWLPFAMSSHLVHGDGPTLVRLLGHNFVCFRAEDGRLGFFDELCPHRRSSLGLARVEGNGLRCIYHGWKMDVSGCVAEAPTQVTRGEAFAASVPVTHFPVQEAGGIAWVWLGPAPAPPFPELPWMVDDLHHYVCVSKVPCNWLQGVEGSIDSTHAGVLHQTWLGESAKLDEYGNLTFALAQQPKYEIESTPYGMRAAALRPAEGNRTYVRITEHLMPLVTVTPVGGNMPRAGSMFVISPIDDTHHLLFFGYFGETPARTPQEIRMAAPDWAPDRGDFAAMHGDRSNRWGQDRDLMGAGHFTGFGRNLLEEDVAVQTSMGPIVDRTAEHLSQSDVAVALARRMLLEAVQAPEGTLPPGSARSPEPVRLPNALEILVPEGERWEEAALEGVER